MEKKLEEIYDFLKRNRSYNKIVQEKTYISAITSHKKTEDKVVNLLYDIANTQSQPKIDKLSSFFKHILEKPNELLTFKGFINLISEESELTYKNLFRGLREQSGWGDKTAALFTKTIFHLHNGSYQSNLKIWDDCPKEIKKSDDLYLPVDSVIIAIFQRLEPAKNWTFANVTRTIKKHYTPNEIEVWDDLWFWGFITQKGSGGNRVFEWNENKYWMMKESEKNAERIEEIREKANCFLNILSSK